jgi:hypothetical protein
MERTILIFLDFFNCLCETNNDVDVYFTNGIDSGSFITFSRGTETSYSNICTERKRDLTKISIIFKFCGVYIML